jgi:hypothetical protein
MKTLTVFLAYAALVAFSLYVFELTHDWRPDRSHVPISRAWFAGLTFLSLACLVLTRWWWLPAVVLAAAFVTTPFLSDVSYGTAYIVYGGMLTAIALSLGWARRPKVDVR